MSGTSWFEYTQNLNALEGSDAVWPLLSVAVDSQTELLYTGDASGRVTTYMLGGIEEPLERQTSFLCSHTPIRRLHATNAGLLVQSDDSIQLRTAGGRKVFGRATTPNDLFTASAVNYTNLSEILVCTSAGAGTVLNLDRGTVQKRMSLELSTVAMDYGDTLTLGTLSGTLCVRDPRSAFKITQAVTAFSGPVTDMVVKDALLFACGMSADAQDHYQVKPEATVKVYDVRKLTGPLDGIECEEAPNKLWVADDSILWMCYESGYAESRHLGSYQDPAGDFIEPALSEYAYSSAFCISPSNHIALVADTEGLLHVWTNTEYPALSIEGGLPDVAVPPQPEKPPIGSSIRVDDESISLSCVPMPTPTGPLLSRMDIDRLYDVGRPVGYVDPAIAGNLKQMGGVGYAPNPRTHKRNQQPFGIEWRRKWKDGGPATADDDELTQGRSKFLSLQRRWGQHSQYPSGMSSSSPQIAAALLPSGNAAVGSGAGGANMAVANSGVLNGGRTASYDTGSRGSPIPTSSSITNMASAVTGPSSVGGKVPSHMQQMRIEYSRFGVEDFDFSLYNSTHWSGLEGNISNSYANSLLQVMFFNEEFRTIALSHCSTDCPETCCLTCQLGFLFRMLETANGQSCHATQLLQVLADRTEATALALLEDAHGNPADGTSYSILIQRLLRFVLEQANNECAPLSASSSKDADSQRAVEAIVGFPQETRTVCPVCTSTQARSSHVFSVDLESPYGTADLATLLAGGSASVRRAENLRRLKKIGITELIEQALAKSETTRAWCAGCKKFQLLKTEKSITQAPTGYLAINFPSLDSTPSAPAATTLLTSPMIGGLASAASPMSASSPMTSTMAGATASGGSIGKEQNAQWQLTLPKEFGLSVSQDKSSTKECRERLVQVHAMDKSTEQEQGDKPAEPSEEATDTTPADSCDVSERFELVAVISSIRDAPRGPEHLVAHVRDPDNHGGWLLFNDFLVQHAPEDRVTGFYDWWRTPSVAIYANTNRQPLAKTVGLVDQQHPYKISTKILTHPSSILDRPVSYRRNGNARSNNIHSRASGKRNAAVPLTKSEAELLNMGEFMCALDAEFVVLEAAKTEVFSDGTQEMIRPPIHTLARLSVVRANDGPMYNVPFIDDYVQVTRPIADLATQYSGIHAGDLTPGTSPYKLSTAKEVYKKLRLLVDSGCVIIGHGLKHDFRVCDIVVPPEQQRDTMVLFQSQSHIRPIALRFLYWYFHHKSIQSGEHSSVEDAQATLKVYESYIQCTKEDPEDGVEGVLDDIYALGATVGWKVPEP